jgi:hypothetical protein
MSCLLFAALSRVPLAGMRLRLCQRHVGHCRRCRLESEPDAVTARLLVTAESLSAGLDLRPAVEKRIAGRGSPAAGLDVFQRPPGRPWSWAAAAAMLALALLAGYWAFFPGRGMQPHTRPAAQRPLTHARLCSARIADRPARVFQVQSRNPDRTIFWIARDDPRS